ncbi:hypothetical protein BJX96DRAFT_178984 [Aspergillus floccosus]
MNEQAQSKPADVAVVQGVSLVSTAANAHWATDMQLREGLSAVSNPPASITPDFNPIGTPYNERDFRCEMCGSAEISPSIEGPTRSLIELVAVAATALAEALKSSRVYRDLRLALALLVAEIRNIELLQDDLWRGEVLHHLGDLALSFDKALDGNYLESNYQRAKDARSTKISLLPSWLMAPAAQARISAYNLVPESYLNLRILNELVNLRLSDFLTPSLLTEDFRVVTKLTEFVTFWNDLVDRAYSYEVIEYEEKALENQHRKPFVDAAGFGNGPSVRHLAGALYDVLHHNWPCQSECHNHTGKLGLCASAKFYLDPSWSSKPPDSLHDGFFLSLAGSNIIQECRVCLHFNRVMTKTSTPVCLVDPATSCSVCLHLVKDENNKLWDQHLAGPLEIFQPGGRYMQLRLGKILKMVRPTYAAKRVLGVILARSLLYLLEGPWVKRSLDIDDIYIFCRIEDGRPYPVFDKVFLSTVFTTDGAQGSDRTARRSPYNVHPFPLILALGIILAEIELGEDLRDIYSEPEIERLRSRPYQLAPRLLRECNLRFGESGLLRAASFCVDRASFLQFVNASHEELIANKDFVTTYYNKAVRPLEEDLVKGAKWTKDEVNRLRRNGSGDDVVSKFIAKMEDSKLEEIEHNAEPSRMIDYACERLSKIEACLALRRRPSTMPEFLDTADSADRISMTRQTQSLISDEARTRDPPPTTAPSRPTSRNDFEVVVICALPLEANAVLCLFDQLWDEDTCMYGKEANDPNSYSLGLLGGRNVVLAHPPRVGRTASASVAASCAMSFRNVKLALVVGVCGGVPFNKSVGEEIRLGDVVISKGVIQYDFGRQFSDHFRRKIDVENSLGRPNDQICSLLAKLETKVHRTNLQRKTSHFLAKIDSDMASYPGEQEDKLYRSSYRHKHQDPLDCSICAACKQHTDSVCELARTSTCEELGCHDEELVRRRRRNQLNSPVVHIGFIASGDSVVKSEIHRDQVAEETNAIAFEMEGAGVWDTFPCVIIKGVCDYADSHKNKRWQEYAAASAAACTKAFIQQW